MTPARPNPALAAALGSLGSECYRLAAEVNARGVDAGTCYLLDVLEAQMAEFAAESDAARLQFRGEARAAAVIEAERPAEVALVKKFKASTKDTAA